MANNTLAGGGFQDSAGNPLAGGRLVMKLSSGAVDRVTGKIQICNGYTVTYPLDANGNVAGVPSPFIWANNNILPAGTYYMARVYSAKGELAWGPNAQYVNSITLSDAINITSWVTGNPA